MEYRENLEWIEYNPKGFNKYVGPFNIARIADDRFYMCLTIRDEHLNQGGVVHGGVSMTLADNGMGVAAFISAGQPASTIEFSAKFIAAAKMGDPLHGEAVIERRTKDLCFLTAELWSGQRKSFVASGVWKYINPPRIGDGWSSIS
ncbi:MAG: PaaI family thioesterase [Pikeienuella sp.]